MATTEVRSKVRRQTTRWVACGVSVAVSMALTSPPAIARPAVSVTFRHRPSAGAVAVDGSGRIYTVSNEGADRDSTAVVRAYAPNGTLRWARTWRPPLASVAGVDISVTPDGTIAVTGRIASIDPDVPCDEIWSYGWAVKTWARDGAALWQRAQTGWRDCEVFGTAGRAVAIGPDAVVVGVQHGDEYSASVDLVAFGRDGEPRWLRHLSVPGSENEIVGGLALGSGGGVYAAMSVNVPTVDPGQHDGDAALVKRTADGRPVWVRRVPDAGPGAEDDHDRGTSVAVLADGVLFGALMDEPTGPDEARIAMYGWGGALRWQRRVADVRAFHRSWPGPWVGSWSGGTLLARTETASSGHTRATLRGFDRNGGFLWRMRLGPTDVSRGVHALAARGGVIALAGGRYDPVDSENRVWIITG